MEKVSIIIPVHNGADKLTKTVNALLKQSYQNIEIVLVENFSSDNSLEVCQTLSQSDERVKVLQSFDKGTTYARKKGILNASGEYIT
ncbi:MAG: glycosyltransferase family 2 protein, partial [Clostridia bacterium]|nr:glycosyltransferase family 2 protein [Clostridia bacterium]